MSLPLGITVVSPAAIMSLCVVAGLGTVLLLPGRREGAFRAIGGAMLAAAGIILLVLIAHQFGGWKSAIGAYFWIFSAIAVVAAVRVVTDRKPVYSALYFVLAVFAVAGLFVLMYAEFMAAALVIIYAGAILITYVFVIMLAAAAQGPGGKASLAGMAECDAVSREPFFAACVGFALMGIFLFMIFDKAAPAASDSSAGLTDRTVLAGGNSLLAPDPEQVTGSTQSVGAYLFGNQLVSLELAGVILTVSMVGAIIISRRRVESPADAFEPSVETINATMTPVDDSPSSIPVYGTTNPRQKAFPQT